MSLAALAIRLAAVEALAPAALVVADLAGDPVEWPTAAGIRVYDTYGGIEAKAPDADNTPIICVFTEESSGSAAGGDWSADLSSPLRTVTNLVFEIEVNVLDPGDEAPEFVVPPTFPEAEALLNTICAQIHHVLRSRPSGRLFRAVSAGIYAVEMLPYREQLMGTRFARMTLRMRVLHHGDDWAAFKSGAAALPDPLATVAAGLPAGSYGTAIVNQVAAALQPYPAKEPLEAVQIGFDVQSTPSTVAAAPVQASVDTDGQPDL